MELKFRASEALLMVQDVNSIVVTEKPRAGISLQ
jgi:hypothetical protein